MAEFQDNLWAPWRMEYIATLSQHIEGPCFLCYYRDHPDDDERNLVLWRSDKTMVILNRYPYTSGHLLIAPTAHLGGLEDLEEDVLTELILRLRDGKRVLQAAVRAHGFNIGMNVGSCAGASLPEHLHWHIVPRWSGDTNFMPVLGDVRVVPQALEEMRALFMREAAKLGL